MVYCYDVNMTVRTTSSPAGRDPAKVGEQLDRILHSKAFRQVDRLQRFLSFIVSETLAGRGENLKEFLIGVEVFGKEASFDPRMDPIVRVQARRLRARLTRYYREEGRNDEIQIELPKGGYAPAFQSVEPGESRHSVTSVLAGRNTITVAPYVDDSQEHDLDYFCRGLTEEIVHVLTNTRKLRVIPWAQQGQRADAAAMRITGSIRRFRETLRITTHIVDVASGCYLWSASLDRCVDNPFAVQEEVARSVVDRLQSEISTYPDGRADIHEHPLEPLMARLSITKRF